MIIVLISIPILLFITNQQQKQDYTIEINGNTWEKSIINIGILPQEDQSWWKTFFINATLRSINQWNDAIQFFSSYKTQFSFLSNIQLKPTIIHENVSTIDIYINFIPICNYESNIGKSQSTLKSPCTITKNVITVAAKAPSGHIMNQVDIQNIVNQELGHALGLGHSNYSNDVMYHQVQYQYTVKPISSLDLYGLTKIFGWLENNKTESSNNCPEASQIDLFPTVNYFHIPIAKENIPSLPPQNIPFVLLSQIRRPEIFLMVVFILTSLVIISLIFRKKKFKFQP